MTDMTIKQALREAEIVTKFLGDPWGFEKKITKREAKIIVANHGLDLSDTADDDLSDIWQWLEKDGYSEITFTKGTFFNRFEIWEHRTDCIGSQDNPDVCSCGIKAALEQERVKVERDEESDEPCSECSRTERDDDWNDDWKVK